LPGIFARACAIWWHAARFVAVFVLALPVLTLGGGPLRADPSATVGSIFGPFGPEGQRMREQFWLLPSGDPAIAQRATVFRPADSGNARLPLVVINHGTSEANRVSVSMPVYYWLSRWFVERGYAVVLPQRRGHGATGGDLVEAIGDCTSPHHYRSGLIAAEDVGAAVSYMAQQPFVDPARIVVAGISTGGWASLALAGSRPDLVAAVVNFAGGRGGHAWGRNGAVCGESELIEAAGRYAHTARAPTLWLYAQNDSYFGPKLAAQMAAAWKAGGGGVEYVPLRAYGHEGHAIADDRAGWDLWGESLDRFLAANVPAGAKAEPQVAQGP